MLEANQIYTVSPTHIYVYIICDTYNVNTLGYIHINI